MTLLAPSRLDWYSAAGLLLMFRKEKEGENLIHNWNCFDYVWWNKKVCNWCKLIEYGWDYYYYWVSGFWTRTAFKSMATWRQSSETPRQQFFRPYEYLLLTLWLKTSTRTIWQMRIKWKLCDWKKAAVGISFENASMSVTKYDVQKVILGYILIIFLGMSGELKIHLCLINSFLICIAAELPSPRTDILKAEVIQNARWI